MKAIIKTLKFELPVYSTNVIFVYSNSYEAVGKFAKQEELDDKDVKTLTEGPYKGYMIYTNDLEGEKSSHTYVIVKKHKDRYEEIDTISHEVLHAISAILGDRGLKFNKHNEEAYAYLIGYLNKEFHKFKDGK